MASNNTPNFDSMKVSELKSYLKDILGASVSGNKPALIKRAKLYHSKGDAVNPSTTSNDISEELRMYEEKRKIFHGDHEYHELEQGSSVSVPHSFDSDTISEYLSNWKLYVEDEEHDISTDKPAKKGEQMYYDKMIQFVQLSEDDVLDLMIFRANINASMAQEVQ